MRRLTAVFSSKKDKSTTSSSAHSGLTSQSSPSLALPTKKPKRLDTSHNSGTSSHISNDSAPPTPQLSAPSQSSSSSSGSASVSLQTPEPDEELVSARTPRAKSWMSWLGRKSTIKQNAASPRDRLMPEWRQDPPPLLRSPPAPNRSLRRLAYNEPTSSSESEDEDETASLPLGHGTSHSTLAGTSSPTHTLQILTQNSLRHWTSPSPFVVLADSPLYPRSCNSPRTLRFRRTFGSDTLKANILRRLQDSGRQFTPSETASISPFASRPNPKPMALTDAPIDEAAPFKATRISPFSVGVGRWVCRPCFEDRYLVWMPVDEKIICERVTGTALGVAELEYSDALHAMIASNAPGSCAETVTSPEEALPSVSVSSDAESSLSSSVSDLSVHNRLLHAASPSPLREEHNAAQGLEQASAALLNVVDSLAAVSTPSAPSQATVKRGVRFAEDDKEDTIPIGYVMRIKKHREDKARFLREERERRLFEEERARVEAERQKREQQRMEWEREKNAWEKEKRAMEDERRHRLYTEEVVAARQRRETQRMGDKAHLPSSSSVTSLKEPERPRDAFRYSRPAYDSNSFPRRQASEPTSIPSHTPSPHSSSPSSSRPPSISSQSPGQSITHLTPPPNSHRPSIYSVSSEDVTSKRASSSNKRHSLASLSSSGHQPTLEMMAAYPMWPTPNSIPPIPPVMPYTLDMPLLPPTAPFMLHQYPRPRSNHSSSPGHSNPPSRNNSTDRVNQPHSRQSSSSPQRASTSSSSPRLSHHRRSSGDGTKPLSLHDRGRSQSTTSASRSQPNSLSRGRPPLAPSSYSQPSPWTALPSQTPQPPNSMPQDNRKNKRQSMPAPRRGTS